MTETIAGSEDERLPAAKKLLDDLVGWLEGRWEGEGAWHFAANAPRTSLLSVEWTMGYAYLELNETVRDPEGNVVHEDRVIIRACPDDMKLAAIHLLPPDMTPLEMQVTDGGKRLTFAPAPYRDRGGPSRDRDRDRESPSRDRGEPGQSPGQGKEKSGPRWRFSRTGSGFDMELWFSPTGQVPDISFAYRKI